MIRIGFECVGTFDIYYSRSIWHNNGTIIFKGICNIGHGSKISVNIIGNNVWICCRNSILKGSKIPDGCVLAAGSLIFRVFSENNCIIGGNPCKILKNNISWRS